VRTAAIAATIAAGALACEPHYDPCFAPQSYVSEPRIVGVRADPPEAVFDPDSGVIPDVFVSALLARPQLLLPPPAMRGRLCAPSGDCAGGREIPRSPDGRWHVRATLAELEAARDADPLRGHGGIRLVFQVDTAGTTARKVLLYSPPAAAPPNRGLEVLGFELLEDGVVVQAVPNGELALIPERRVFEVRPILAPGDGSSVVAEEYEATALDGSTVRLRERIRHAFYSTALVYFGGQIRGGLSGPIGVWSGAPEDANESDEADPGDPLRGLMRFIITDQEDAILWVVSRDSRGAEAFGMLKLHGLPDFSRPVPMRRSVAGFTCE
jgi:hypothetical protein